MATRNGSAAAWAPTPRRGGVLAATPEQGSTAGAAVAGVAPQRSQWGMAALAGEERIEIDAPAADVWAYRLDFMNLPQYNPDVSAIERARDGSGPGGIAGAGAHYRFTLSTPVGPHPVTLTVTGVVEDREVRAEMAGGLSAHEVFVVDALGPTRCAATLSLWLDLPPSLDETVQADLLAGGRQQIRKELDLMGANLAG